MDFYKMYKENNKIVSQEMLLQAFKLNIVNMLYLQQNEKEIKDEKEFYSVLFPEGTRVELLKMVPDEKHYQPGLLGTVSYIDDAAQIHINWDNGSSLAVAFKYGDVIKVRGY